MKNENFINNIFNENCLDLMKELEDNSIDSIVSDPPYGLSKDEPLKIQDVLREWVNGNDEAIIKGKGFMGKEWDAFVPPPVVWKEAYRILKPGAYMLIFSGTRTQDLMTISMRMAGFQVKDVVEWLYFSGFPKSHNISKAITAKELYGGSSPQKIRQARMGEEYQPTGQKDYKKGRMFSNEIEKDNKKTELTKEAIEWEGWGTQLKPSHEPIILVQKPISEKTIADNVLKWGTGGLNIDDTRIETDEKLSQGAGKIGYGSNKKEKHETKQNEQGRFPANSITEDEDEFYSKFFNITPKEISKKAGKKDRNSDYMGNEINLEEKQKHFFQTGNGEIGKPSSISEGRNTITRNNHPTVKSIPLMEHLIKMITPKNGVVFDPFLGSGTTVVAARSLSFKDDTYRDLKFLGSEMGSDYYEIARARIFPEEY